MDYIDAKPTSDHVANSLKEAMEANDINAAELSRQSGVSIASLSRILAGQVNPSLSSMVKISKALNISLDMLTGSTGFASTADDTESTLTEAPTLDLATDFGVSYRIYGRDESVKELTHIVTQAASGQWVNTSSSQFVADTTLQPAVLNVRQCAPKTYDVDVIFPHTMLEAGSITNIISLASTVLNISGATLTDMHIPHTLIRTFSGPAFGITGLRDKLNKHGRPLLSATVRPMHGIGPRMYGKLVHEMLKNGLDFTCDPTLLYSLPINDWRERTRYCAEATAMASNHTNEFKQHLCNVSASTYEDIITRATFAKEHELEGIIVDPSAIGLTALQSLALWCRENGMVLAAMGSRKLMGMGMEEQLQAKIFRLIGCDIVSMASPIRGDVTSRRQTLAIVQNMRQKMVNQQPEAGLVFTQNFHGMNASMPAVGGGHNPWHFPRLVDALDTDCIIQCGGSVMAHPYGHAAGATANRTAIEATIQAKGEGRNLTVESKTILQQAQRYNHDLKEALTHWQEGAFLFGVIPGSVTNTDEALPSPLSAVVESSDNGKPSTITTLTPTPTEEDSTDE